MDLVYQNLTIRINVIRRDKRWVIFKAVSLALILLISEPRGTPSFGNDLIGSNREIYQERNLISGKFQTLRDGKVAARDTPVHCKINGSRKMIIYPAKMHGLQVAIICMDKLGQDRLKPQKLWCAFQSPPIIKRLPTEHQAATNDDDQEDSRQRQTN